MGEIKQHAMHTSSDMVKPDQQAFATPPLFRPVPVRPQGAFQPQPPQWLLSSPSSSQTPLPLSRASTPGDDADYIYLPESSATRERKLADLREALMEDELAPLSKTLRPAVTPILLTVVATMLAYTVFFHGIPLYTSVSSLKLNVDVEEVSDTRWLVVVLLILFCIRLTLGGWQVEDHPLPVSQPGITPLPHTHSGYA